MNSPQPSDSSTSEWQTTTVFTSGNSQAVRLPKALRLQSRTVQILRRGNEIVLREKPMTVADALRELPPLSDKEAQEWDRAFAHLDDPLPQERDWNTLFGDAPTTDGTTSTRS